MLDGLAFLFACIAIGLVQYWMVLNDKAGPADPTTWYLAIRSKSSPDNQLSPDLRRSSQLQGPPARRR